jgi:hypothetical protein
VTRDELRAAADRVCIELAIAGTATPRTLELARAVAMQLTAERAERAERTRVGARDRKRAERQRDKSRGGHTEGHADGHGDASVTGPPRHASVRVTSGVTSRVTSRGQSPSALPLSDQDPLSSQDLTEEISEERENARAERHADCHADNGVTAEHASVARETAEPWVDRDDVDEFDPPDSVPTQVEPPPDVALWRHWEAVVHGGLPGGSRPRSACFDALQVLSARGIGVERAPELIEAWLKGRQSATAPRFEFWARDLATLLDQQAKKPAAATPASRAERVRKLQADLRTARARHSAAAPPERPALYAPIAELERQLVSLGVIPSDDGEAAA